MEKKVKGVECTSKHSTERHNGICIPANDSYQQSSYIAAISRFVGVHGLEYPVSETVKNMRFDFDFFDPEARMLIKVFRKIDAVEIEKYHRYSLDRDVFFIVDCDELETEVRECECCGGGILTLSNENEGTLAEHIGAFVFYDDALWRLSTKEGTKPQWSQLSPVEWENGFDAAMEEESDEYIEEFELNSGDDEEGGQI